MLKHSNARMTHTLKGMRKLCASLIGGMRVCVFSECTCFVCCQCDCKLTARALPLSHFPERRLMCLVEWNFPIDERSNITCVFLSVSMHKNIRSGIHKKHESQPNNIIILHLLDIELGIVFIFVSIPQW